MNTEITPEFFLKGLVETASRCRYVAVPSNVLEYVQRYPREWMDLNICGTLSGPAFAGGSVRDDLHRVDLWCCLAPGHQGDHGFASVLNMPAEGSK